jgi:hypothetical protein
MLLQGLLSVYGLINLTDICMGADDARQDAPLPWFVIDY